MNFLEKFLSVVAKVGEVATGIEPTIVQALPTGGTISTAVSNVTDDLTTLGQVVTQGLAVATALGKGSQPAAEIQALVPLVSQTLLKSELLAGKKVSNAANFQAGALNLASGIQQILSAVE